MQPGPKLDRGSLDSPQEHSPTVTPPLSLPVLSLPVQVGRVWCSDDPQAWERAGFTVLRDAATRVDLGNLEICFAPPPTAIGVPGTAQPGLWGWEITPADPDPGHPVDAAQPNHITAVDHIVVDGGPATVEHLESLGLALRRHRPVPSMGFDQYFFRSSNVIVELISRPEAGPEWSIWGLALTSPDLDSTVEYLGTAISPAKPAVQPGRRIATIRTSSLNICTELAVMSPHPPRHA